jgi:hypothetical protein
VRITKIIPTAMMDMIDICTKIFLKFAIMKKRGDSILIITHNSVKYLRQSRRLEFMNP